jgi:hypothetical protein
MAAAYARVQGRYRIGSRTTVGGDQLNVVRYVQKRGIQERTGVVRRVGPRGHRCRTPVTTLQSIRARARLRQRRMQTLTGRLTSPPHA